MKIQGFQKTGLALAAAVVVALSAPNIFGQNTIATPGDTASAAATTAPVPALTPAMQQVLQLSQAKIGDSTIIAYVQNSGTVYGLDAPQIVYLKQQGVSEPVINAMLNQRAAVAAQAAAQAQTPPPNNAQYSTPASASSVITVAQPATPAPSTTYIVPDTQTYNYNTWAAPYYYYPYTYYYPYPYYYNYYPVGIYFGWHGGYYGGWHGGGSWHGGGGWHH